MSETRRRVRSDRTICVWPKCPEKRSEKHPQVPLCGRHIEVLADQVIAERSARMERSRLIVNQARERNGLEPFPPPSMKRSDGVVYYLLVGDRIKIGHTVDLPNRLGAYPPNSVLLALHEGSRSDETALHRRFRALVVAGREWYPEDNTEILAHIAEMVALHGEPSQDFFKKRQAKQNRQAVALRSRSGGSYKRSA